MSIPQPLLETALVERLKTLMDATPQEIEILEAERRRVTLELSNLVEFVIKGDMASPRLRDEISVRERRLIELDQQIQQRRGAASPTRVTIDRVWVATRLQKLNELIATDPQGARREIQKHIEDLRVAPAPDLGERAVRITGRGRVDGLLGGEEAVRLQLVAGARFELWKRPLMFEFLLTY